MGTTYAVTVAMPQMQSGTAVVSGKYNGVTTPAMQMRRQLQTPIKLRECHNVYHISWNQYLSEYDQPYQGSLNRGPQIRLIADSELVDNEYNSSIFAGFFCEQNANYVAGIAFQAAAKVQDTAIPAVNKWYHCDFYIYTNDTRNNNKDTLVFRYYEYGKSDAEAREITTTIDSAKFYNVIQIYTYTLADNSADTAFHGISDLKITEYAASDQGAIEQIDRLLTACKGFNPAAIICKSSETDSQKVQPMSFAIQTDADIAAIESIGAPEGTSLSWRSSDPTVLGPKERDASKLAFHRPESSSTLCLTAVMTDANGRVAEKDFPITVIGQPLPSRNVVAANLASYPEGTGIGAITVGNGWSAGFTPVEGFCNADEVKLVKNEWGSFVDAGAGSEQVDESTVQCRLTRPMDTALSLDSDKTYYIKWRSMFRNDVIVLNDAVKIIISALGQNPVAEEKGGYPAGYIRVAAMHEITAGVRAVGSEAIDLQFDRCVFADSKIQIFKPSDCDL